MPDCSYFYIFMSSIYVYVSVGLGHMVYMVLYLPICAHIVLCWLVFLRKAPNKGVKWLYICVFLRKGPQ